MKILRKNVTSYVYNLFTKNSKLSLQITDLNKCKGSPCSWITRLSIAKIAIFFNEFIESTNYQKCRILFFRIVKLMLKSVSRYKGPRIDKQFK